MSLGKVSTPSYLPLGSRILELSGILKEKERPKETFTLLCPYLKDHRRKSIKTCKKNSKRSPRKTDELKRKKKGLGFVPNRPKIIRDWRRGLSSSSWSPLSLLRLLPLSSIILVFIMRKIGKVNKSFRVWNLAICGLGTQGIGDLSKYARI